MTKDADPTYLCAQTSLKQRIQLCISYLVQIHAYVITPCLNNGGMPDVLYVHWNIIDIHVACLPAQVLRGWRMQLQEVLIPLLLTLKVVFWSTLIAAGAGIIAAYLLCRKNFPGRDWLDAACSLPLVLPPTVLGYYLIVVIGRNGLLGQWLEQELGIRLMFTWQGAVVAAAVVSFPLVFKSARAAFESVPPSYLQAARILGAGEWEIFFRVTLPLAFRGVLAGTMLAFARGMGEFGATLMVAGNLPGRTQTLSLAVYSAVQAGNDGLATILVCVVSIVCVVLLVVTGKLVSPNNA